MARLLLLALVYYLVARASLGLSFASTNASPVWPPSGIALAALLLGDPRLAVGVFIGAFGANLATFLSHDAAPWVATAASALIAVGNVAEAALASWVSRRFIRGGLTQAPQAVYVFGAATLVAATVSASGGVTTLVALGVIPRAMAGPVWLTWWLGDVIGLLVIAPFLLQLRQWRPRLSSVPCYLLALAFFVVVGGLVFGGLFSAAHLDRLMAFGLVLFIAWAALRHGAFGAASATFGVAALSIAATLQARGPFAKATVNDSLVSLDGFLALCAITGMVLVASMPQRDAAPAREDRSWRSGRRLSAGMLLGGLAATLLAWHFTAADTERRAGERFASNAEDIKLRITERMTIYEHALRGGRGLFDASTSVERDEWHQYVQSLTLGESYPGIQGIGFAAHVSAVDLQRHIDRVRSDGWPDYAIRPAGERSEYTSIVYLEPQDPRNRRAIGYDMFSEPVRRAAMEQARDSGDPAVSGRVTLLQESDQNVQAGFLMYVPVYRQGLPVRSAQQRQAALMGYVYSPFRMDDLMQGVLKRVDLISVSLTIFDGPQADSGQRMYTNDTGRSAGYPHQFVMTVPLLVAGHRWTAELRSTQAFEAAVDTQKAQIALVAGTLISLLLFTAVRALALMREEALALAHKMSAARAEAEQRYELLAESASDGILVLDERGQVEFSNRAGCQLFGQAPEQLVGRHVDDLLDLRCPFTVWTEHSLASSPMSQELEAVGCGVNDVPTLVEVSLGSWVAERGRYFSLTVRDISARRQAERSLREAMQQAEQASLAKSQFLANMSHEIRTPMNAVIGLTYLMEKTSLNADQSACMTKIGLASKSLMAVIDDVLDLSKIEAGELFMERAPFDLPGLLAELGQVMAAQAQVKGIGFTVDVPADLPKAVEGDALRLNQVLGNLLSNAIKFTDRGDVVLRIRVLAAMAEQIRVRFTVHDSGIGIAPQVQAKLFAPFAQADASTTRRFGGTGLGLSIVKRLTELMGGVVGVISDPSEGSEFWVEMDFALTAHEPVLLPKPDAALASTSALRGVRVLVVDDSEINREVASRILLSEGAIVTACALAAEVLDRLRLTPDGFDIVLMDVQMPGMDGNEATRRLRTELGLADLPVIALTAGALLTEKQRAIDAGMDDFISKPLDPQALIQMLRRHVERTRGGALPALSRTPASAPPADAATWPEIAGIDRADVSRRLGHDLSLFLRLLGRLWREFDDLMAEQAPVVPSDTVARRALAARLHKLRGSAGMIGAHAVQALAQQAESCLREDTFGAIAGSCESAAAEAALVGLGVALRQLKATSDSITRPLPVDEVLPATLPPQPLTAAARADLVQRLRLQDLSALDCFVSLTPQLQAACGTPGFEQLRDAVENLHFAQALELLDHVSEVTP